MVHARLAPARIASIVVVLSALLGGEQAHSAPLGLAFVTGHLLPVAFRGGLFMAFHGSWNRSVPTGYKLVYVPVRGQRAGPPQDAVTGWLPAGALRPWGRPVGAAVAFDGSLLISDDTAGVIYRLAPIRH